MNLSSRRREMDRLMAARDHANGQADAERSALAKAKRREADAEAAQAIVQEAAEAVQNRVHRQVASVVSRCLRTVFGEEACEFQLRFVRRRGKTEADMVFLKDGMEMAEPLDESSGGQLDVAAMALRLVTITMALPRRRRLLVLDEPFRFVHGEIYRRRLAAMLSQLAGELGFQIILATGLDWLRIGKVIELNGG